MAKKLYEETNIYNIACALREKCGDESKTYKTCDMAQAIRDLNTSGGGSGEEGPAWNDFSGKNMMFLGTHDQLSHIINYYGDQIIMRDMTGEGCNMLLSHCNELVDVKFDVYFGNLPSYLQTSLYGSPFNYCPNLKNMPYLHNAWAVTTSGAFNGNKSLREIPDDWTDDWQISHCTWSGNLMFNNCHSLRKVPAWVNTRFAERGDTSMSSMFYQCSCLDEVVDLPCTRNRYYTNMFGGCSRLKRFTIATNEDGTPATYAGNSGSALDMTQCGYVYDRATTKITGYNSGITEATQVTSANYEELKNHPDYWTLDRAYSRYNHTSAVETINSLPDMTANNRTGTIKFDRLSGASTDGGAIGNLTEEEIAVAAAKGWTVTLV